MVWRFRTYRGASGRDDIADWTNSWHGKNRSRVLQVLDDMQRLPKERWPPKAFKLLSGPCAGLGEIRFKLDRVQYRILTFFGPGNRELTMLLVAEERNWSFVPKNACE